jgi:hypothetical protein
MRYQLFHRIRGTTKRDLWLEIIVIGLITIELLLGFYQQMAVAIRQGR